VPDNVHFAVVKVAPLSNAWLPPENVSPPPAVPVMAPAIVEPAPRSPYTEDGLWLVRPDGYVALVAKAAAWPDLDRYLAWIAGAQSATAH